MAYVNSFSLEYSDNSAYTNEQTWGLYIDGTKVGEFYPGPNSGKQSASVSFGDIAVDGSTTVSWQYLSGGRTEYPTWKFLDSDSYDLTLDAPTASGVSATIAGSTKTLSNGGSYTQTLGAGSNSVSVSTTSGSVDIDVSWKERNGVENPSISVGSSTVSYSGLLDGTHTESVDLSRSDSSISASYTGAANALDYDLSWTEDHRAHDPSVTVDGSTVSHTGPLASG
jgi:hypothetical protein